MDMFSFYRLKSYRVLDAETARLKIHTAFAYQIDKLHNDDDDNLATVSETGSTFKAGSAQRDCFQRDCEVIDRCDKLPHELDVAGARNLETGDFENDSGMNDTAAEMTDSRDNAKLPASFVEDLEVVSVPIQLQDVTVAQRNESRPNDQVLSLGACHGSRPFASEAERPTLETERVARAEKSKAHSSLKRRKKSENWFRPTIHLRLGQVHLIEQCRTGCNL